MVARNRFAGKESAARETADIILIEIVVKTARNYERRRLAYASELRDIFIRARER